MDISEKRVIGSLILLTGVTFLAIAAYTGQLASITEFIGQIFGPAVAGMS